jgi:signal transduction histidine kinase
LNEPLWTTTVLLVTFAQFLPVGLLCVLWLRQGKFHQATTMYVASALIPTTSFTLFMPEIFLLVGMMGYILFIRVIFFLENQRTARNLTAISVLLYLGSITIRLVFPIPVINFGSFVPVILYILPVMVLILFTLLDQIGTRYLRNALQVSEEARKELEGSYRRLEEQTAALERSELALSKLATRLENRNQELELTNNELKTFSFIISHDLRAPLINLKGFTKELHYAMEQVGPVAKISLPGLSTQNRETTVQLLERDIPEALTFIDSATSRMDRLLDALLKLSQFSGRQLVLEQLDMETAAQKVIEALTLDMPDDNDIKFIVGSLPQIQADRTSMNHILTQLLNNAIQYLSPDRPGKIEIFAEDADLKTTFHIRDNGQGIAETEMHKLFQPFRQIGEREFEGVGMGLAFVQTLVRRHGGRVWCESEEGIGSTFSFTVAKEITPA